MKNLVKLALPAIALVATLLSSTAGAVVITNAIIGDTCGKNDREATLVGAAQCAYTPVIDPVYNPNGTLDKDDINVLYATDTIWENVGELTANGTNEYLSATSDEGWGKIPNSGDWAILPSFWGIFDRAVISMHIGGGQFTPDNFAWLLTEDSIGGITDDTSVNGWSLSKTNTNATGGGLSNLVLWGSNFSTITTTSITIVPGPATLGLFAIGLLGVAASRRRTKLKHH
jgi:hypothetical protein